MQTVLTGLTITLTLTAASSANALTLGYWNFNALSNPGSPSNANQTIYSPTSGAGTLTLGSISSNSTGGITNFTGTTINVLNNDPAGQALAIQGNATGSGTTITNNGSTLTFLINLTGYADPILTFATQRTSTGFSSNQVSYSTDGTTFTNFSAAYIPATAFALQSFDFSSIDALDGVASAYFRITLNGATSGAGNNRFDNFQINATEIPSAPVPTPALLPGLVGMGIAALRKFQAKQVDA